MSNQPVNEHSEFSLPFVYSCECLWSNAAYNEDGASCVRCPFSINVNFRLCEMSAKHEAKGQIVRL